MNGDETCDKILTIIVWTVTIIGGCIGFVKAGIGGAIVGAIVGMLIAGMLHELLPLLFLTGVAGILIAILIGFVYIIYLLWGVGRP